MWIEELYIDEFGGADDLALRPLSAGMNVIQVSAESAALRLLPIGQGRASEILWRLKPVITMVAEASDCALSAVSMAENLAPSPYPANVSTFTPLVDLGSMRHPTLRTRLFIS